MSHTLKKVSLKELHEFVHTRIKMVSDRMKARYDHEADTEGFHEGQLVLLYNPQRKKRCSVINNHREWSGNYKAHCCSTQLDAELTTNRRNHIDKQQQ